MKGTKDMGENTMKKKPERNPASKAIAEAIFKEYRPKTAEEMQSALKDVFGPLFEAMLQGEMDDHLGYETNDHGAKTTENRRNGYIGKTLKTSMGDVGNLLFLQTFRNFVVTP